MVKFSGSGVLLECPRFDSRLCDRLAGEVLWGVATVMEYLRSAVDRAGRRTYGRPSLYF